MRLKNLDLIVAVIIAALNMVWVLVPSRTPVIGTILALPLVFVLPGYTLTEALFHKQSLKASHRLVFSLGLSLAIGILSGLILNMLQGGLQATSWAILLGLLTAVFSLLVAYLRRGVLPKGTGRLKFRLAWYEGILFGLATTLALLSILYAAIGETQQTYPGFTQLWILPQVQAGKSCAVRLGVRSFESTSVTYRITMTINGAQVTPRSSIKLDPKQEWDQSVPIPSGATDNVYVEAQLYRLDKPEAVYRQVHMTLYSCTTSPTSSPPFPTVASTYKGTIHDIPMKLTTSMSLTGIEQRQGNITGYFGEASGPQGKGPFRGTVTATKHIQFTVTNATRHAILSFDGAMQSDGTLAGTYCSLDQGGRCSGDYGLWSVTPTST